MAGCKKNHSVPPPAPALSSAKTISLFELLKADNPNTLEADVTGLIRNDTIYLTLPAQTPLTSLVPYIVSNGKSISPASGSSADFANSPVYTVTADDGSTQAYTIIIRFLSAIYLSDGSELVCMDGNTGNVNWSYQSTSSLLSTPTTGNGLVYVTGYDGLYAVSAINGSLVWKLQLGAANEPFKTYQVDPVMPIPILVNGIVYGSFLDGTVRAVNAKNGAVNWTFTTPFSFGGGGPTLSNSSIYVGSVDGSLYSIDSSSGTLNWRVQNDSSPIVDNPLVFDGNVYYGSQGQYFYAVQANNGQLVWKEGLYADNSSPAESNRMVYMTVRTSLGALDPTSGATDFWATHTGGLAFDGPSSAYLANGNAYLGSAGGYVYANNAITGSLVWTFGVGYNVYASPVVADGRLYITDVVGHVIVLDAATGNSIWITNVANGAPSVCFVDSTGVVYHPAESGENN